MIKDLLTRLNEYTEEPDAFETESERIMQKELEDKLDQELLSNDKKLKQEFFKKRNALINSYYKYFSKIKFIRNLSIQKDPNDKRYNYIEFWIPEWALSRVKNWKEFVKLNLTCFNSSQGYRINIQ